MCYFLRLIPPSSFPSLEQCIWSTEKQKKGLALTVFKELVLPCLVLLLVQCYKLSQTSSLLPRVAGKCQQWDQRAAELTCLNTSSSLHSKVCSWAQASWVCFEWLILASEEMTGGNLSLSCSRDTLYFPANVKRCKDIKLESSLELQPLPNP